MHNLKKKPRTKNYFILYFTKNQESIKIIINPIQNNSI